MSEAFDAETLVFYQSQAIPYTARRPHVIERHLPEFLDRLPERAAILELGCGSGLDAAYMIERGFAVDPTDGVAAMAAVAQSRLRQPVRVMRFDELDAEEAFDAVVAVASLLHTPRNRLPDVLGRVWRALKPGGLHFASYKAGGVQGRDQHGRYYNYLDSAALTELYATAAPWAATEITSYFAPGHFGPPGPWLQIVARKQS